MLLILEAGLIIQLHNSLKKTTLKAKIVLNNSVKLTIQNKRNIF